MKHVEVKKILVFGVKAIPPKQHLERREQIQWSVPDADENSLATLFFPNAAAVFGAPVVQEFPASRGITLTAKDDAPRGAYKYTISCIIDGEEELAEGLSPPQVIID